MKFYLGGPIRENNQKNYAYDVEWRSELKSLARAREASVSFNDPIQYDGIIASALHGKVVFNRDKILMQTSDAGIFNLLPFSDGYPCIGALVEIGMMESMAKPCFVVTDSSKLRHHPMLTNCVFFDSLELLHDALIFG